jgi:hypothetical protein
MGGHMHYWCGYCMAPRRFVRSRPEQTFTTNKKFWSDDKGRYIWKEVTLAVIECRVCHGTNRDGRFRRNNQPYEIRRFKQGVRRARRRKR